MKDQLAAHGGPKAISGKLPTFGDISGRTFGEEEERLVIEALRSGCLSRNGGTMVHRLEAEFSAMLGVEHVVACSSGTSSLHLAVAAIDLEPGDEVIVPPITDIGTIAPILWQNAVPVFADIDIKTMVLDPEDVRAKITPRTRAIMAVHLAGQPCDLRALRAIADEKNVVLIEDCSQAYWAEFDGKLVGTIGDIACFSLQQSKHMTCGEGGLMATRNAAWARRALLFSDKAWPRDSKQLGSGRFLFLAQNYRMSELQGAVALAQLHKVVDTVASRRKSAEELTRLIAGIPEVEPPTIPAGTTHSYWLYMLHVKEELAGTTAKEFGDALVAEGISAWVQYIVDPLYLSPLFAGPTTYGTSGYPLTTYATQQYKRGLCPKAEAVLKNVIAIHWNEKYTSEHVQQIAAAIRKVARHYSTVGACVLKET